MRYGIGLVILCLIAAGIAVTGCDHSDGVFEDASVTRPGAERGNRIAPKRDICIYRPELCQDAADDDDEDEDADEG